MQSTAIVMVCAALLVPGRAPAAVADSSASGFTAKLTLNIQAPPDDVYRKLVGNIGDWWEASHTFSGNPHNLMIDDKPGGCFCEKLASGGGVRHMQVLYADPGKRLVLSGAPGPMQTMAVAGSMTIELAASNGGTKLDVTYAVAGYLPAGMNTFAPIVDSVVTTQFTRLKNYAEHGDPAK
jgi:uncharacterized protein YndB with AHSA1/START domain